MTEPFDAVVLAGGAGSRMGRDKPVIELGGVSLLDRVLGAVLAAGARRLVVAGPSRSARHRHLSVSEEPAGGGPVAALAAGLPLVQAPSVAVLAADLPFLDAGALQALRTALGAAGSDGAVAKDDQGRVQWLVGVWRTEALLAAVDGVREAAGASLGDVLGSRAIVTIPLASAPGSLPPWFDCDTPADLGAAQTFIEGAGR